METTVSPVELFADTRHNTNGKSAKTGLTDRHGNPISLSSPGIVMRDHPRHQAYLKIIQANQLKQEYYLMPPAFKREFGYTDRQFRVLTMEVTGRLLAEGLQMSVCTEP
jgi:hypothetical protein